VREKERRGSELGSAWADLEAMLDAKRAPQRLLGMQEFLRQVERGPLDDDPRYTETIVTALCQCLRKADGKEAPLALQVLGCVVLLDPRGVAYDYCVGPVQKCCSAKAARTRLSALACLGLLGRVRADDGQQLELDQWFQELGQTLRPRGATWPAAEDVMGCLRGWSILLSGRSFGLTATGVQAMQLMHKVAGPTSTFVLQHGLFSLAAQGLGHPDLDTRAVAGRVLVFALATLRHHGGAAPDDVQQRLKDLSHENDASRKADEKAQQRALFREYLEACEGTGEPRRKLGVSSKVTVTLKSWASVMNYAELSAYLQGGTLAHVQQCPAVHCILDLELDAEQVDQSGLSERDRRLGKRDWEQERQQQRDDKQRRMLGL